jgi:GT2 family glycosyltransferase
LPNPDVTFVVPSLGTSHYLRDCLGSAAASEGVRAKIVLVHPPSMTPAFESIPGLENVVSRAEVGFSEACNLGIAASSSEYVALLNDDATVEPEWAGELIAALRESPRAAAAQGVNLQMAEPERLDGRGLEWNRSWQAIQIGHGELAPESSGTATGVFGVSATAAVYRRSALDAVSLPRAQFFDVGLESYYEDVDLACRLRGAGYTALSVPTARAHHAGAVTTRDRPMHRYGLIYGNRYLVLARTLGRAFWLRLPQLLVRDFLDLGRAAVDLDHKKSFGIMDGWVRAARHLSLYLNTGEPKMNLDRRNEAKEC